MFWKLPYEKLFRSRVLPIIVYQNYRLLELGGEPVYLLVRVREDFSRSREKKRFTSTDLQIEGDFAELILWEKGKDFDENYPDIRDIQVFVDGNECVNVYAAEFVSDIRHFFVRIWRHNVERGIEHRVSLYFLKEIAEETHSIEVSYFRIHPDFDESYGQSRVGDSKGSKYGWRQLFWRGVYYQGRIIKNAFLMAFPDLPRDLGLDRTGFVPDSRYAAWTSPPPLSPFINEHDIIVRLNGLRYEVRDVTRNFVNSVLVQQDFTISEISPSNPVYDIEVDTEKGVIKGFPYERIYSG